MQEKCRKNLKKEYRTVKDNNNETGRDRKTCKHYDELDEILGHRPASIPAITLDTGREPDTGRELDSGREPGTQDTTEETQDSFSQVAIAETHTNGKFV